MSKRIPRDHVVEVRKPVLVAPAADAGQPMTVIPLVDGDEVAGLEIRCRCGSRVVIDCVYEPPDAPEESR